MARRVSSLLGGVLLLIVGLLSLPVLATNDGESILHGEIGRLNNQSLFWGPYKPNLYFGVRPRTPKGLWTGLMWSKVITYDGVQNGMKEYSHEAQFRYSDL